MSHLMKIYAVCKIQVFSSLVVKELMSILSADATPPFTISADATPPFSF